MMKFTREALTETVKEYQKVHGYLPGLLELSEEDAKNLYSALLEKMTEDNRKILEKQCEDKGLVCLEYYPLMGMRVKLAKETRLCRQSSDAVQFRKQSPGSVPYMPVADITNSMHTVVRASLRFFDTVQDESFNQFVGELAAFLDEARQGSRHWEEEALPRLEEICGRFQRNPRYTAYMTRFFMCVIDFYWHCSRLSFEDEDKGKQKKEIDRAMDVSSLLRMIPQDVRGRVIDHMAEYGMLPDVFSAESERKP